VNSTICFASASRRHPLHEGGLAARLIAGRPAGLFELDVGDHDLRSFAREELGRGLADPRRDAGDERNLSLKPPCHVRSLV
jgi:hypothetical protein